MRPFDILIEKLDQFIRKYYSNLLTRGIVSFLICCLLFILLVSVSEYYFYFSTTVRLFFWIIFIALNSFILIQWICRPLLALLKLGKRLQYEDAAVIIGKHFPEIDDKLINVLQLQKVDEAATSSALLEASIEQKSQQLSVFPIAKAINVKVTKKRTTYLLILLTISLIIAFCAPQWYKDSSHRLLHPTVTFKKPAPFTFYFVPNQLEVLENENFNLLAIANGSVLPEDAVLLIDGEQLPMQKKGLDSFSYVFKNCTKTISFSILAAGYETDNYQLKVLPLSNIKNLSVRLKFPNYIGKKEENRTSWSDLQVPEGTQVHYEFDVQAASSVWWQWSAERALVYKSTDDHYSIGKTASQSQRLSILLLNKNKVSRDTLQYQLEVIKDQFPQIQVQKTSDTFSADKMLMHGVVSDDYKVSYVKFVTQILGADKRVKKTNTKVIAQPNASVHEFDYYFDKSSIPLVIGDRLQYYFEVWDNDAIHGSKCTKSDVMQFAQLTTEGLDAAINQSNDQMQKTAQGAAQQSKQMQQEFKSLSNSLAQQGDTKSWEQQKSLQELSTKQEQLKVKVDQMKQAMDEQLEQLKQNNYSEALQEKQSDLQKQLKDALQKELEKQMQKMQELLQQKNTPLSQEALKDLEQENKLFAMDLQRLQALMKQLEHQIGLEQMAKKIDALAKEQEALKQQTDTKKQSSEELSKQQAALEKKLEALMQNSFDSLKKEAQEQSEKAALNKAAEKAADAKDAMQKAKQALDKKDQQGAAEQENEAKKNLEEMASMMQEMSDAMDMEQVDMDIKSVRQLLTNLIRLSFDQERLMNAVAETNPTSSSYLSLVQQQKKLQNQSVLIKDSLYSLSKRLYKLAPTINKETSALTRSLQIAIQQLEARVVSMALTQQQYAMTHTNNLALMLNEMLMNLVQQKNQQQKSGKGSCNKPGGKKPKPGAGQQLQDVISKQGQLGGQLGKAEGKDGKQSGDKQGNKQGDKEGDQQGKQQGKKEGAQSGEAGDNGEGNAEKIARLAQQQAAIRRQLAAINAQLQAKGLNISKELKAIMEEMDKNETDLVNRKSNQQLQLRQKSIETRLLEAQKALREQEQDETRAAEAGEDKSASMPSAFSQLLLQQKAFTEWYKTVPPELKPHYQKMVDRYYQLINK